MKDEGLEHSKVMVGTVTHNEQRRQQISSIFMSLVAAGIAAMGAVPDLDPIYITAPGVLVCLVCWSQIRFLKRLATAKFAVIARLEEGFSFRPFAEEWKYLKRDDASRSNGDRRWYHLGLSDIEMIVPAAVGIGSAGHILLRAIQCVA